MLFCLLIKSNNPYHVLLTYLLFTLSSISSLLESLSSLSLLNYVLSSPNEGELRREEEVRIFIALHSQVLAHLRKNLTRTYRDERRIKQRGTDQVFYVQRVIYFLCQDCLEKLIIHMLHYRFIKMTMFFTTNTKFSIRINH